ncbi:hypothetical protein GCM10009819_11960 [Agromyces tropicus]|uniref:Uncharacterized protein n=1 Tax=Agromyces tropicus TaxID=555371 RepID=A0ABP5FMC6_9MICO
MLAPSVLLLLAVGIVGVVGVQMLLSWSVEAQFGIPVDDPETQRRSYLMSILPNVLAPTAAVAVVGAALGLPLVIGARLAALARLDARMRGGPRPEGPSPTAP